MEFFFLKSNSNYTFETNTPNFCLLGFSFFLDHLAVFGLFFSYPKEILFCSKLNLKDPHPLKFSEVKRKQESCF